MRLGDLDRLAKDIEPAVEDAPLHVQATVQQYIDCSPTIDPICAVGGCRCGECQRWQRFGEPLPDGTPADWGTCTRFLDPDSECEITTADGDFCSYGEPREAQDDG